MTTDPPDNADIPPPYLKAIESLKNHTTFLWKNLISPELDNGKFTCPIRQSSYNNIKNDLRTLYDAGFFQFNILQENTSRNRSVIRLELSEISDSFLTIIHTHFSEPEKPHPSNDNIPPPPTESPIRNSTRPLNPQAARSAENFFNSAGWLMALRGSWYMVAGILLILSGMLFYEWTATHGFWPETINNPARIASTPPPAPPRAQPKESTIATRPVVLKVPAFFSHHAIRFANDAENPYPPGNLTSHMDKTVFVDVPRLTMHAGPSFQAEELQQLRKGERLHANWLENGWLHVEDIGNHTGWVTAYSTRDAATLKRITLLESPLATGH
ncbi:MAG: SH3 domain-containing protein [Magnetococcales bacterium]|nr:SH3 domain-containing protein [Magnetococcales bacterium]